MSETPTLETPTIDHAVLDVIADEAVLRFLTRIVNAERQVRAAYSTPVGHPNQTEANRLHSSRRSSVHQLQVDRNEALEGLRNRILLLADQVARDEAGE